MLGAPRGQLHRWPVNHIGLQQNVFIIVDNVSFVMDNVKNNSIMRGHFLVGGCAAEAQCENSCEPSCLCDVLFSKNVKLLPTPPFFGTVFYPTLFSMLTTYSIIFTTDLQKKIL